MGVELQYGSRENFGEPSETMEDYLKTSNIFKVQFSFKYNFSHKVFL